MPSSKIQKGKRKLGEKIKAFALPKALGWLVALVLTCLAIPVVSGALWQWSIIAKQRYKDANKNVITPKEEIEIEKEALDAAVKVLQAIGSLGFIVTAYAGLFHSR